MAGLVKKFLASASVVAGMSAVFGAPAMAASITNATVTGPNVVYSDDGTGDLDPNLPGVDLTYILQNANYGNVELSGQLGSPYAVDMVNPTTLEVLFDDNSEVTFRSMTWDDWFGAATKEGYNSFFHQWYNEGILTTGSGLEGFGYDQDSYNYGWNLLTSDIYGTEYNVSRFSDANVASVSRNDDDSVFIQLAGHNNHSSGFNFSEVVVAEVDGAEYILYKFGGPDELATVFDDDSEGSHEGLYNFKITLAGDVLSESVPEPSTLLGLMAIGGLVAATKRKSQK